MNEHDYRDQPATRTEFQSGICRFARFASTHPRIQMISPFAFNVIVARSPDTKTRAPVKLRAPGACATRKFEAWAEWKQATRRHLRQSGNLAQTMDSYSCTSSEGRSLAALPLTLNQDRFRPTRQAGGRPNRDFLIPEKRHESGVSPNRFHISGLLP